MGYWGEVYGPFDLGALMVAFVETKDANGVLFNPPGVAIEAQKWQGGDDWLPLGFLWPGTKDLGKCELAPLVDGNARYRFRVVSVPGDVPLSDWVVCDLGRPFVPPPPLALAAPRRLWGWFLRLLGQYHKSFLVIFHQGEPPPPPAKPTHTGWTSGPICAGQFFTAFFRAYGVPLNSRIVGEKCNGDDDQWYPLDDSLPLDEDGRASYTPLLGVGPDGARFRWRVVDAAGAVVSTWAYCDIDEDWAWDGDAGGPCRAGFIPPNNYRRPRKSFHIAFVRRGVGE